MITPRRILTKKTHIREGICLIIENGVPCNRPVDSRGICTMHKSYLRLKELHEEFALPVQSKKRDYRVNPEPLAGKCCVIEEGIICEEEATRHGKSMCLKHYGAIWQRQKLSKDIDINDFRTPLVFARQKHPRAGRCVVKEVTGNEKTFLCKEPADFRGICTRHADLLEGSPALFEEIANPLARRKKVKKGTCVVQEITPGGEEHFCSRKLHARGLCLYHYNLLRRRNPGLFEKIADPEKEKSTFRVKRDDRQREGICVIVENDNGCNEPATKKRRICTYHYHALMRAGLLEELTDPFIQEIQERSYQLEQKLPRDRVQGFCILTVNGIPCTNTPKRRGLCDACIWKIGKFGYDFEALALPPMKRGDAEITRKETPIKGICVVIENGVPCRDYSVVRGLCKYHYQKAKRQHKLSEIALSAAEIDRLADTPHFYFDKNLIIRYALHEMFGQAADSSIALVDAVVRGRLHATVSTDCIRALYSHLGHQLARPAAEGGKALEPKIAEKIARDYAGKLFFGRGGAWNFVSFQPKHFELCAYQGCLPKLSLEDALELQLFSQAKETNKVNTFVTGDRGILEYGEGVHSDEVMKIYADFIEPHFLAKRWR